MELHRVAWENGWTYGPGFDELYEDYLINWVYFVDYLDLLILRNIDCCHKRQYPRNKNKKVSIKLDGPLFCQKKIMVEDHFSSCFSETSKKQPKTCSTREIKILIGEAPPFWAGNSAQKDRSYFYNVKQTRGSTWLNAPFKYFHYKKHPAFDLKNQINFNSSNKSLTFPSNFSFDKPKRLNFLAKEGVILLDIFPFPIRQATKIRETVTADFSEHLKEYFGDFYEKVKKYIICKANINIQFKYALVTPIFTGLQILYGSKSKLVFEEIVGSDSALEIKDFSFLPVNNFQIQTYLNQNFTEANSFKNFFGKIAFDEKDEINLTPFKVDCPHSSTPILMDASGNVNFSNFFNADISNLIIKIESEEKENEDEV